ncbi:MAG: putative LPS assembly protein LptD [Capnocytophaga sp.]|nr:putative LPS assembly protein LptD [Capnocytophaga sp.]
MTKKKDTLKRDSISLKKDTISLDSIPDSLSKKPAMLTDIVKYHAKDCVVISKAKKEILLYNQTNIAYADTDLKAGASVINYEKREAYAGRIKDSVGELVQAPEFKQGDQLIEPDSIRFNYVTKRAIIKNAYTTQSENKVKAETIKKENDSTYFLRKGKITTAEDLDDPDYYILVYKAKFVPKKKIVAGFSNMYIADVPTPIAMPFAYYPMTDSRSSGLLFPTFGEVNDRGYYLQNGGYYFVINDYLDLALTGDYYTNGSYGIRTASTYRKRYKYSGSFNLRYENLIQSQRGFPDYSRSSIYNIQWSHSQDSKSSPLSSFSASVNLGSSTYYRDSYNQLNSSNFLNNTLSSSISYSRTFPSYPSVNMSLTASHSQNTNTRNIQMTLPAMRVSMERIYPFASKGGTKKGLIQNMNFNYSMQADNRYDINEDLFFRKEMFDRAVNGVRHSIPVSTNFKVLKFISFNLNTSLNETWQFRTIQYQDYDQNTGIARKDTLNGFARYLTYNFGAGLGTTIYGTFDFGKDKKIQAIRHVMRPSVSYGYTPSFDQYYKYYIADAFGTRRDYTPFDGGIYGAPGRTESNNMSFSLSNTFEAKVRSKDSLATEPKKIMLLNSLNFSSGYNFITKQFSALNMTGGTQLFDNKLGVNFGATFNPYAIDENGRQMEKFNISNGGSLFRMTNANLTMNYAFSSKNFKKGKNTDNTISGGRADDLFGAPLDTNPQSEEIKEEETSKEDTKTKYYYASMPWDINLAYSLSYANYNRNPMISTNSLMVSGNIDLTPKWRIGASSGYDFKDKGITYTQLRFERDLNSFRMSFSFTPFGYRNSWNFFIGIKASMLSDLKWEKNKAPDRTLR